MNTRFKKMTSTNQPRRLGRSILGFLAFLYFAALVAVIAYLWLGTQDRFISIASVKISKASGASADTSMLSMAIPGLSDSGSDDAMTVIGFIESSDTLLALEKEFDLSHHYSAPKLDLVFRLDPKAQVEDRLDYYRSRITADINKETGLVEFSVDSFNPALSQKMAAQLLGKAENFVNDLNQKVADQQLSFYQKQVDVTRKRVDDLTHELLTLQNKHNLISPDAAISSSLATVQEMKMDYLRAEAELSSILRDSPNSPRIASVESHIKSVKELIDVEMEKLSGPEQDRFNQLLAEFKELQLKIDFAVQLRTSALAMLEKNRVDSISQSKFFSVVQNPYLPEKVGEPQRKYATISIIVLGLLLFVVMKSLCQSILDR